MYLTLVSWLACQRTTLTWTKNPSGGTIKLSSGFVCNGKLSCLDTIRWTYKVVDIGSRPDLKRCDKYLFQAVCCLEGCCPEGYMCDVTNGICII